jgi:hypothetical protein
MYVSGHKLKARYPLPHKVHGRRRAFDTAPFPPLGGQRPKELAVAATDVEDPACRHETLDQSHFLDLTLPGPASPEAAGQVFIDSPLDLAEVVPGVIGSELVVGE